MRTVEDPPQPIGWIVVLFLLALGLLCLWQGRRELRVARRLRDRGVRTTATVIGHERAATVDQPVFGYTDHRGDRFTLTPNKIHNTFTPVGDRADVLYLPEHPQTARLAETEGTPRKGSTRGFVIGTILCAGAVAFAAALTFVPSGGIRTRTIAPPMLVALVLVVTALLLLAIPVVRITRVVRLLRTGIRTDGVVVRKATSSEISNLWLVDFTDHHGRRLQFTSEHTPKRAGAAIPVVYPRDRPQKAAVGSLALTIRRNVPIVLVALFFLALSIVLAAP